MKRMILSFLMVMTLFGSAFGMQPESEWDLEQNNKESTSVDASEFKAYTAYLDSTMSQELKDLLVISGRTTGSAQGYVYKAIRAFADEQNDPAALYILGANPINKDLLKRSAALGYFPAKVALAQLLTDDEADERYRLLGEIAQGAKYPNHETYTLRHAPSEKEFEQLQAARYKILSALQAPSNLIPDMSAYHKLELFNGQDNVSALEITQEKDQSVEKYRYTLDTMLIDPRSDHYIDNNRYATKENYMAELAELAAAFTNHSDTNPTDRQTRIRAINALRFITIKSWLRLDDVQTSLKKLIELADPQFSANQGDAALSSYEHFKALVQANMAANPDITAELDELIAAFKKPSDLATRIRAINALRGISSNSSSLLPKLKELITLADPEFVAAGNDLDARSYKRRYAFYRDPILKALETQEKSDPVASSQDAMQPHTDVVPMASAAVQQPMETSSASMPQSSEVTPVADTKQEVAVASSDMHLAPLVEQHEQMKASSESTQPQNLIVQKTKKKDSVKVVIKDTPKAVRDFKIVISDLKEKLRNSDTNTKHLQNILDEIKAHNASGSLLSLEAQDIELIGIKTLEKLRAQKLTNEAAKCLMETIVVPQQNNQITVRLCNVLLEVYGSSTSLGLSPKALAKIEETVQQISSADATTILKDMKRRSYQDQDGIIKVGLLFAQRYRSVDARSENFKAYIADLNRRIQTPDDTKTYAELVTMDTAINLYREYCVTAPVEEPNRFNIASRQLKNSMNNGKLDDRIEKLEKALQLFPEYFENDAAAFSALAVSAFIDEKNKKSDTKTALNKAFFYLEKLKDCRQSDEKTIARTIKIVLDNNFEHMCVKEYISRTVGLLSYLMKTDPLMVEEIFSVSTKRGRFEREIDQSDKDAIVLLRDFYANHVRKNMLGSAMYYRDLRNKDVPYERLLARIDETSKHYETMDKITQYNGMIEDIQHNKHNHKCYAVSEHYEFYRQLLLFSKKSTIQEKEWESIKAMFDTRWKEIQGLVGKNNYSLAVNQLYSHLNGVCVRSLSIREKILQLIDTIIDESNNIPKEDLLIIYDVMESSLKHRSLADQAIVLSKMVNKLEAANNNKVSQELKSEIISIISTPLKEYQANCIREKDIIGKLITAMESKQFDQAMIEKKKVELAEISARTASINQLVNKLNALQ